MTHPIPKDALDDRLGFIGTSGSGKTYNAGGAVERLLKSRARVVIVDPLGVWWGLRLLADGKTASQFNVAIFGGPHGDLPLTENAGALIGETAATMAESCIVDLSELGSKSADRRFMTAFLDTIYRKAPGEPFHLVVDEADLFAPQKPPKGDETLLNLMEQIVRRGRVRGFIPWLISQRPAVLNKNVLSQVDGLIAFKLTASQDRDALDGWIEGQADKAQGRAIKDALPAMQIGSGVVWVPGRGVLQTAAFPMKDTFDSSRTPKRGEKKQKTAALKPLDLGALKERLATVETETKANDPKALKAQIAWLSGELRKAARAPAPSLAALDPAALNVAHRQGYEAGYPEGWLVGERSGFTRGVAACHAEIKAALGTAAAVAYVPGTAPKPPKSGAGLPPQPLPRAIMHAPAPVRSVPIVRSVAKANGHGTSGDAGLTGPQRQLLGVLAWWEANGHARPTRSQIAAAAGWRITAGHLKNVSGSLRSLALIDYPSEGVMALTEAGRAAAPVPDLSTGLIDRLRPIFSGPQRQAFDVLLSKGAMDRSALCAALGWNDTSGHVKNVLGSMRSLEVVDYPAPGQVALQGWITE